MESLNPQASRKGALVVGGMLVLFGILSMVESYTDMGFYLWVGALLLGALALVGLWATDREQLWILLPAYALTSVAGIISIIEFEILDGSEISGLVFALVAIPFVASFFIQPVKRWGLLIPAYMVAVNGLLIFLVGKNWLDGRFVPAFVMGAIALPFWLIVIRNPDQWWAAIPAGIVTLLGFGFILQANQLFGRLFPLVVSVALIAGGGWMLVSRVRRQRADNFDALDAPIAD